MLVLYKCIFRGTVFKF